MELWGRKIFRGKDILKCITAVVSYKFLGGAKSFLGGFTPVVLLPSSHTPPLIPSYRPDVQTSQVDVFSKPQCFLCAAEHMCCHFKK